MSDSALERTARALDLVPYLLEHQGISTTELATVFGVSEKQINEDLVLIHMCGLPGYTPLELIEMYYEDGFVTVSDPQSLKKPRKMSRSEMTSLLVSLDLMKSLRSDEIAGEIAELQDKLRQNMIFENPIVVVQNSGNQQFLQVLEGAIAKSSAVKIVYLSGVKDERSEREVFPLSIYLSNGVNYLNAWCQTSKADRTFRLDRILSCEPLSGIELIEKFSGTKSEIETGLIRLKVARAARNFVEENRTIVSQTEGSESEEEILVTLNPIDTEWLIRSVLGYGGLIEVVEPEALVEKIKNRARAILELYS
ncbi:COG2378 Predicted transcriptional regulator [actinobacterium SCGC AAA044-D11]